ncbi:hypothetical protein [Aeromonas salmonicida]|uniref:Uncharacterized protein n=1 Tax=bacterium 19CA06SA08-2 TaxID=2920658 RepID=A0AAU6U9N3_UNCXX|nr:hypothetical protein [Aeromonas salmonicida]MDM5099824.1 hypothetical protein [Aeromonas salmonicida]
MKTRGDGGLDTTTKALKGSRVLIGQPRNGPIGRVRLTFQGQFSRFDYYAGPAFDDDY